MNYNVLVYYTKDGENYLYRTSVQDRKEALHIARVKACTLKGRGEVSYKARTVAMFDYGVGKE